jgi:hypothetical protein
MKKIILTTFFLCVLGHCFCQEAPPPPPMIIGSTVYTFQNEDIQGSPFLFEKWNKATIITNDKKAYSNEELKFDLYKNKFIFSRNNTIFELTPEASIVYLYTDKADTSTKMLFKKGYQINSFITTATFLQVLTEGKTTFLKFHKKNMEEFTEYADATKYKRFRVVEQYFMLQNAQFVQISLSKKNLETALQSKWAQVDTFMKQNNLSGKDEKSWIAAIGYYNTL